MRAGSGPAARLASTEAAWRLLRRADQRRPDQARPGARSRTMGAGSLRLVGRPAASGR